MPYDQAVVDSPYIATVRVLDGDGAALSGVAVHWTLPRNDGLDSVVSYTEGSGQSAITWRPPTVAGTYRLHAAAGHGVSGTESIDVRPGAPVSLVGLPDSIRFTRMDGHTPFSVKLLDKFGNQLERPGSALTTEITGPFAAAFVGSDIISLGGSRWATGVGDVALRVAAYIDSTRPVLARVKLVMDPVVANVAILGGVDSVAGLAVGEVDTILVSVRDSSGIAIPGIDVAKAGVQFATSNAAAATISPTGVVTGVGAGTVTISAAAASSSYAVSFRVGEFSIYDFGAVRQLYNRPLDQQYYFVGPISIDAAGNSLLVSNEYGRPTGSSVTMHLAWFDPNGQARLSHDYRVAGTASAGTASLSQDDGVYVSYPGLTPLVALDADGAERWRVSTGGTPIASASGVYVYDGATLHALYLNGKERWSHDFGVHISQVAETSTIVFVRTSTEAVSVLVGLSLSGDSLWARPITGAYGIVDAASTYYAAAPGGGVQAIDQAGNVLWTTTGGGIGRLALGPGQSIIVTERYQMRALDRATGNTVWSVNTPLMETAPIDVVGGKIYRFGNYLYVWDAASGASLGRSAQRWTMNAGRCTSAGPVFVSGLTVYRYDHC